MSFIGIKFLILAQMGIDIAIIVFFILLINKVKSMNNGTLPNKEVDVYESLLVDAKDISEQFNEQLKEKHHLINKLNEKLDEKIMNLNVLLSRVDSVLSHHLNSEDARNNPVSFNSQEEEILKLASQGYDCEKIAHTLSMSKGEVTLVLDIRKKIMQLGQKEQDLLKNYVKEAYLD